MTQLFTVILDRYVKLRNNLKVLAKRFYNIDNKVMPDHLSDIVSLIAPEVSEVRVYLSLTSGENISQTGTGVPRG